MNSNQELKTKIRKQFGTYKLASKESGVSVASICRAVQGKTVNTSTCRKLSESLNLSEEELMRIFFGK